MAKTITTARLAEQSVRDAARHRAEYLPRKPRKRTVKSPVVDVRIVHPDVWRTALRLAQRDVSRITIVSSNEVVVR
jgi:hypothetical protein